MASVRALEGITVFEFGNSIAGPFAGLILSDLGAEVLKIENPKGGDHARGWGPPFWEGDAALFHVYNRGKKSFAVDISDPAAAAALKRDILSRGDVVIQNMRAGVLERFGLGANDLLGERPDLIYCNLGAFGETGPLVDKPGYDPLVQAFSGLMSMTGEAPGRPPVRVPAPSIDMGAGMWSAIGILASLLERARTKKGGTVSTSLYETALGWMAGPLGSYAASGVLPMPRGSAVREICPYQCFATRDGFLMISAGNDGLYRKLCGVLERPDWAADARFVTNGDRVAHREILVPMIAEVIRPMPIAELTAKLDAAAIPNAPIQTLDQVMAHPQTAALGILGEADGGGMPIVRLPFSLDGVRPARSGRIPALGEHNEGREAVDPPKAAAE